MARPVFFRFGSGEKRGATQKGVKTGSFLGLKKRGGAGGGVGGNLILIARTKTAGFTREKKGIQSTKIDI